MKRYAISLAVLAAATALPSIASAQYAPPRPAYRTFLNPGLVARADVGVGYLYDSVSVKSKSTSVTSDYKLTGLGVPVELALGITLGRQLVIGGQVNVTSGANPQLEYEKSSTTLDMRAVSYTVGPYIEYYPAIFSGFHIMGSAGFGGLTLKNKADPNASGAQSTTSQDGPWVKGFAASIGVGQNFKFSPHWSVGIRAQVQYMVLVGEDDLKKETHQVWQPGLLAQIQFN